MCRKTTYPTKIHAELALRAIRKRYPDRPERGVHFCSHCRGWHLTSRRKSQREPWARVR